MAAGATRKDPAMAPATAPVGARCGGSRACHFPSCTYSCNVHTNATRKSDNGPNRHDHLFKQALQDKDIQKLLSSTIGVGYTVRNNINRITELEHELSSLRRNNANTLGVMLSAFITRLGRTNPVTRTPT